MDIQGKSFLSIEQLTDRYLNVQGTVKEDRTEQGLSFQEILQTKSIQTTAQTEGLKFSKHAAGRLADRNIELSKSQLERLSDGARKAERKGIKDSLVIIDELAFIVNVPNRTVITAMDSTQTDENVFTNINGAVIM